MGRPTKHQSNLQQFLFEKRHESIGGRLFGSLKELVFYFDQNGNTDLYNNGKKVGFNSIYGSFSRSFNRGKFRSESSLISFKNKLRLAIIARLKPLGLDPEQKVKILEGFNQEFELLFYFTVPSIEIGDKIKFSEWENSCKNTTGGNQVWFNTLIWASNMEKELKKGVPIGEVIQNKALKPSTISFDYPKWSIEYWSVNILYQCWKYGEYLAHIPEYKIICKN